MEDRKHSSLSSFSSSEQTRKYPRSTSPPSKRHLILNSSQPSHPHHLPSNSSSASYSIPNSSDPLNSSNKSKLPIYSLSNDYPPNSSSTPYSIPNSSQHTFSKSTSHITPNNTKSSQFRNDSLKYLLPSLRAKGNQMEPKDMLNLIIYGIHGPLTPNQREGIKRKIYGASDCWIMEAHIVENILPPFPKSKVEDLQEGHQEKMDDLIDNYYKSKKKIEEDEKKKREIEEDEKKKREIEEEMEEKKRIEQRIQAVEERKMKEREEGRGRKRKNLEEHWIKKESTSRPGKFYMFNVTTGESKWL